MANDLSTIHPQIDSAISSSGSHNSDLCLKVSNELLKEWNLTWKPAFWKLGEIEEHGQQAKHVHHDDLRRKQLWDK